MQQRLVVHTQQSVPFCNVLVCSTAMCKLPTARCMLQCTGTKRTSSRCKAPNLQCSRARSSLEHPPHSRMESLETLQRKAASWQYTTERPHRCSQVPQKSACQQGPHTYTHEGDCLSNAAPLRTVQRANSDTTSRRQPLPLVQDATAAFCSHNLSLIHPLSANK